MGFDNFEVYPGNDRLFEAAKRFAEEGIDRGAWLVIQGKTTGTGKSHLLASIANAAIARGVPTFYGYTTEVLDHLREGYRRGSDEEEGGDFETRFNRLKRVRLLLLDDFGVQVNTDWAVERMLALFEARDTDGLPTAITTNLGEAEFQRISDRLLDRLQRHVPGITVENRAIKYRDFKEQERRQPQEEEIPW